MNAQELLAFLSRHPLLALGLAGVTLALLYTEAARLLQRFRTIKPGELVPSAAPEVIGSDIPIAPLPDGFLAMLTEAGEMRPLEEIENEVIRFAIAHYRGQMSEVARRLKIGRSTLYRKLDDATSTDA